MVNPNGNLDCGHTLWAASIHFSGEGDVKSFLDIRHLRDVLEVEQPKKHSSLSTFPKTYTSTYHDPKKSLSCLQKEEYIHLRP